MTAKRPLWTCTKCGRRFVTRNLWHSCARYTVDDFFVNKPPEVRELFQSFKRFVRQVGPFTVDPNKTRIAFQGRARFAVVNRAGKDNMTIHFWLKRSLEKNPRFLRVDKFPPRDYVYSVRIRSSADLDDELLAWIRESYAVGQQEA